MAHWKILSDLLICSFLVSDLSDSLTVAHFWWATWANCSHRSFLVSDLSDLLTVNHLSWAIWANCSQSLNKMSHFERMSEFPPLVILYSPLQHAVLHSRTKISALMVYLIWGESTVMVPDFAFYVYSSSCNSLFFGLILSSFHSPSISCLPIQPWGWRKIKIEGGGAKKRLKKRDLHELPDTAMVKSGTISLTSGLQGWALVSSVATTW